ncbi:MAG: GNAT family N-acetyltransferase [Actinomycetota bacterium]
MESYGSAEYCATLSHLGVPVSFDRAGGAMLSRTIDSSCLTDLTGPYPWAGFSDWSSVGAELDAITGPVTATVVVAPTSDVDDDVLVEQFPDHLVDFKLHFLVDLTADHATSRSATHRRKVRRSRPELSVSALEPTPVIADRWVELYHHLGERHAITGGAAFSDDGLRAQLVHPDCRCFGAFVGDELVGMVSFMTSGAVAAYHLGAYAQSGYALEAAYAIFPVAFDVLAAEGVELVNLGGGAGLSVEEGDGLARFKRGWSTHTGVARVAGRILDPEAFDRLSSSSETTFWPPYRAGRSR